MYDQRLAYITLASDAANAIPDDVEELMFWPLLNLDEGGPFVWGLWKTPYGWVVMEYYPTHAHWICNTGVESREDGIAFVRGWMQDFAPDWFKLYFP
ncbi:MAG TPA: hypothetical protein PLY42_13230 [Nitrospira sp.]|nr:hypothetical protein [Nitrospira sp.]